MRPRPTKAMIQSILKKFFEYKNQGKAASTSFNLNCTGNRKLLMV